MFRILSIACLLMCGIFTVSKNSAIIAAPLKWWLNNTFFILERTFFFFKTSYGTKSFIHMLIHNAERARYIIHVVWSSSRHENYNSVYVQCREGARQSYINGIDKGFLCVDSSSILPFT